MIDLHCHILPGLDDGAPDVETSLAMAEVAAADGVTRIVATPHIRDDHPFDPGELPDRVRDLNAALRAAGQPVEVLTGGEVAVTNALELDDAVLRPLTLGGGGHLLVESPYTHLTDMLENSLFELQLRGYTVVLAHPERSPSFIDDLDRLARIVERGVLCSITAGSLEGRFGRTVRATAVEMVRAGLAHDVASDAHDADGRRPVLGRGLDALEEAVPAAAERRGWLAADAPAAMLAGEPLPRPPGELPAARRGGRLRAAWRAARGA